MMFPNVFGGKRVLVTGHTGFKGSWLCAWLHVLGAKVTGYALAPEPGQELFDDLALASRLEHVVGDVRDAEHLRACLETARPEFVFHLAAQPLVRRSYANPKMTFDTNVGGSVNLLEAVREVDSVRVLVYVTSDKCYRNRGWIWGYREGDELGGEDPYSASKACAEIVFDAYRASFFEKGRRVRGASARAGNVIGGGDWAQDRIVPDLMRALRDGAPLIVRNPMSTRPWQHVLEPLAGYLLLAARLSADGDGVYCGAWNFGPTGDGHRTVRELVGTMRKKIGSQLEVKEESNRETLEAKYLHLNCDRARYELGWRPAWSFDEAINETVSWYERRLVGTEAWQLTEQQIHRYVADWSANEASR